MVDPGNFGAAEETGESDSRETTKPDSIRRSSANPKESIRRAKKTCWDSFVQKVDKEQLWKAVRYTAPRLDGKVQTLVDEAVVKATSREERERMLIASAFPKAPDTREQPPRPDGGRAHQRVSEALVGPRRETRAPPEETGWGGDS